MTKAILFDFDGTLVDTLPFYLKAYDRALKHFGFFFTDKEIVQKCFGKTETEICQSLNIPGQNKKFAELYFAGVDDFFKDAPLFSGVKELLELCFEKNIELGIVSFAYRWYVDRMLELLDLTRYFEVVIGFDDVKNPKPHPEAVLTASRKLSVLPTETLVIGDSKSDILMGNAAGATTILHHPQSFELFYDLNVLLKSKPDHVVKDFAEIEKIVLE
jgi:HAD superfamily hydrolase (TIGR01549 family)